MNPKQHIETISKDYMTNSRAQGALQGAMRHVQRSFSRRGHLLMEFIQNAEDACATKMLVNLSNSTVVICNNGDPFNSYNVDSICNIGKSSKTVAKYIGYLGVGFKSTFLLADRVSVHSGNYHFAFDSQEWPPNTPWQIMPVWVDTPHEANQTWATVFSLVRLNPQAINALKDSFLSFQPRTLLWLDHLTDLTIIDEQTTWQYVKTPISPNVWCVVSRQDGDTYQEETWLILHDDCPVRDEVRADQTTKDWDRDEVDVRRVAAAFRLDEHNDLMLESQGAVYVTIYSYTPLKDESVPIHFLMQGDFITAPNRESIHREAEWNRWLAQELFKLLRDRCIPAFLADQQWSGKFQSVLNVEDSGNHPIWDDLIRKPLAQYMNASNIFPAADGSVISLADSIRIPDDTKDLISEKEVELLHPGKKLVADHVDFPVPTTPADSLRLITHDNAPALLDRKAEDHDVNWFRRLYQGLKPYIPLTKHFKGLLNHATPFLLNESFSLSSIDSIFTNPNNISIPALVRDDFHVLHPALFTGTADDDLEQIITELGIKPLSEQIIKKAVVQKQLEQVENDWQSMDDAKKIDWIKFFREYDINSRDLKKFITLPTKSSGWQSPENIILSTEYNTDPDLEKLVQQGLLDQDDIIEPLMGPVLLDSSRDPDLIGNWVSFLQSLGVGSPLTQSRLTNLVQRTATKATIRYEQARGNQARELPESESHREGYDVISKSDSGTRFIEAKGRKTDKDEITITHNQWKALLKNGENYYIYVVTDALSQNPLLYPLHGPDLEAIEFSLRVQSSTWKPVSKSSARYDSFKATES